MNDNYKSPYLPQRKADGVSIPLPKPDYDFEGAVSGFDYDDPKVYPSQVDPDLEGGMGVGLPNFVSPKVRSSDCQHISVLRPQSLFLTLKQFRHCDQQVNF